MHNAMTGSSNTLNVRRVETGELDSLNQFYREYFPDKPVLLDNEIWKWSFLSSPFLHSGIPFFVIEENHYIRGGIGYLAVEFNVNNQRLAAGHPVNFFVAPDYKGLPAVRLLKKVTSENEVSYASYFSKDAEKLILAARWSDLSNYINNYYFPLQVTPLQKSTSGHLISRFKKTIRMSWLSFLAVTKRFGSIPKDIRISRHSEFSDSLCPANLDQTSPYCGVYKDNRFIKWRYAESPRLDCRYFTVSSGNTISALAIIHLDRNKNQAIIMDLVDVGCTRDTLALLFIDIIRYCNEQGLTMVSTVMLNDKVDNLLRKLGFGVTNSVFGLMFYTKDKTLKSILDKPQNWDFWIGHSDVY